MKIESNVSDEIINNALIGAREGATGYWAQSRLFTDKGTKLPGIKQRFFYTPDGENLWNNKEYNYAFNKKRTVSPNHPLEPYRLAFQSFFDIEGTEEDAQPKELFVTHEALQRGLKIMAEKYPKHFADLVGENDDAMTHDVMVQCCLLGDIVYG